MEKSLSAIRCVNLRLQNNPRLGLSLSTISPMSKLSKMPTPQNLLIVDDLSRYILKLKRADGAAVVEIIKPKFTDLIACASTKQSASLVSFERLAADLLAKISQLNFDIILAVGNAGNDVATELFRRADKKILQLDVGRVFSKDKVAIQFFNKQSKELLSNKLEFLKQKNLLILDDTVFSGETLKFIAKQLPPGPGSVVAAALNGIEATRRNLVPDVFQTIIFGFELPGLPKEQSNTINLRDFFDPNGLRLDDGHSVALYKVDQWMQAWFGDAVGGNSTEAIRICKEIEAILNANGVFVNRDLV